MNKTYVWVPIVILVLASAVVMTLESWDKSHVEQEHQHDHGLETVYTCSMHPEVRQSEPGQCPICNMNLTQIQIEKKPETSQTIYTCSMHPQLRQSKPGKCPICGMTLTEVELSDDNETSHTSHNTMQLSAGEAIANIKLKKSHLEHFHPSFFPVTTMKMSKNIRLLGTVLQSEDRESAIPARVGGRVEKVLIKSTGSFVKKGEPVLQIYSPTLISAGQEYIISRKSYEENGKEDFKQLVEKAQERLELWGIRKHQFERWYKTSQVPNKITIHSPSTGIVRKHNAKKGKYFKEGQNFFELSDLSEVWVEMDVYEHDSAVIKLGQKVDLEFSASPGDIIKGEIDFINPILDSSSRTLKVRTTIENNKGILKPGMIADANLTIVYDGEPLVIPRTAVIDTGKRKVAWVKVTERKYRAQLIQTGFESEGYVEVKAGLTENDAVVLDGNFLLDAQAQLFGGYSDMTKKADHGHLH